MTIDALRKELDKIARFRNDTDLIPVCLQIGNDRDGASGKAEASDVSISDGVLRITAPTPSAKTHGRKVSFLSIVTVVLAYIIVFGLLLSCAGGVIVILSKVVHALATLS